MVMTTLVTQPAALRRRASAPTWAYRPVVASAALAAVAPKGVFDAAKGSGMSAARPATSGSVRIPSVQLTHQGPAVAANDGALGYHVHRPPA